MSALLPQPDGWQAEPTAAATPLLASQQTKPAIKTAPLQTKSSTTINQQTNVVIEQQAHYPIFPTDTRRPHLEQVAPVESPPSAELVTQRDKQPGSKVQKTREQMPLAPQASIAAAAPLTPQHYPNQSTKMGQSTKMDAPQDDITFVTTAVVAAYEPVGDSRVADPIRADSRGDDPRVAIHAVQPETAQIPVATQKSRPLREADTRPPSPMPQPDQKINEAVVNRPTQQLNPYADKTGATLKREQHSSPHQVRIGQVNVIVQTPGDPAQPKKARREEREQRGWNRLRSL